MLGAERAQHQQDACQQKGAPSAAVWVADSQALDGVSHSIVLLL